jgi:phosphoglycerol transferase MdoB-like AlkP superfamily enzyme
MVSTGNDVNQLLGSFLVDFWFLIVLFIALIIISEWMYRKVINADFKFNNYSRLAAILQFIIVLPILFLIGRGGFGLKPIGVIEAANFTGGKFTSFVLPTPFTLIKSIDQKGIQSKTFFSEEKAKEYFIPNKSSVPQNIFPKRKNVVFIILESFGTEFIGHYSKKESYTPFLDSIFNNALSFEYAFANGKKSIEAVPAIFASLPTLMDSPYISSPYGNNKIEALPSLLKKHGYTSAFYHGATNGSMSFDGFAKLAGFDYYVGRTEYNNEAHSDNKWGILDEYFNPWVAEQMNSLPQPFMASLFTLSSHHPYFIPEHMKKKVKQGPQPICASINYADIALQSFFDKARKQDWYENTIFVLLADHTPASSTAFYSQRSQMYRIPMAIYDPTGALKPQRFNKVTQQMDLMPTVLDLMNIESDYYGFGNSIFSDAPREAITYISGSYNYFRGNQMTIFSNDAIQSSEVFDSLCKPEEFKPGEIENRLKALIQTYNFDLIQNKTYTIEK